MDEPVLLDDDDLFSRDLAGHLLRMDKPTRAKLDATNPDSVVRMRIDGQTVSITKAVPATDPQGNILYDQRGNPIPRQTTLYDAVSKRYAGQPNPVPILCYQEHMTPVAVCRVCMVQVTLTTKGRSSDKLVPACYFPVEAAMGDDPAGSSELVVNTLASPDERAAARIREAVGLLVELLAADHLHPGAHPANELEALARRFGVDQAQRFARPARLEPPEKPGEGTPPEPWNGSAMLDASSPWFIVDRTACILCDRCIRGCGEVRRHYVLGRARKGSDTRIAFDWDSGMGASSCVQCGECFISCPTDAITIKPGAKPSPWDFVEEEQEREAGWFGRLFSRNRNTTP
jgi:predicted molibdopterin-dependent oxidoreductase YjgC